MCDPVKYVVTGLVPSNLRSPSSNLGRRYMFECLAVSPVPACPLADAGSNLFIHSRTLIGGGCKPMSKPLPLSSQDIIRFSRGPLNLSRAGMTPLRGYRLHLGDSLWGSSVGFGAVRCVVCARRQREIAKHLIQVGFSLSIFLLYLLYI
jgi:hypothetical protein